MTKFSLSDLHRHCSADVLALNPELFNDAQPAETRRNKYNARKVIVGDIVFDSKGEYRRWLELSNMQRAGLIADLKRQVRFELQGAFAGEDGKKQRAITYSADFTYMQDGVTIIEDFKSEATRKAQTFRVRWRLLLNKFKNDANVKCILTGS